MMGGELESVVREQPLYRYSFHLEPSMGPLDEIRKGLRLLVRKDFRIGYPRRIVDHSGPVLLLFRILSSDVLLLVHVDMHELSRHGLLISDYLGFPLEPLQQIVLGFHERLEPVSQIGFCRALVNREVSVPSSLHDLPYRIVMSPVERSELFVAPLFAFSFCNFHLFLILRPYLLPDIWGDLGQVVHIGKWL